MGSLGKTFGRGIGRKIGEYAGKKLGKYTGVHAKKGGKVGTQIGGILGDLLPFKKGGKVTKKTQPALLHKGEFVLPKGVKPTKKQKAEVMRRKRK
jgi:hypothetical protein